MESPAAIETGICIVGAGAAGVTIASELARSSSHDVCLIEAGGNHPDEATQSLYDLENIGYPIRENFMSRARYYGGSCNLWAGRSMVMDEVSFDPREWVRHSGWPISWAELAGYHERAADILRLPALGMFDKASYEGRMTRDEISLFGSSGPLVPTISLWAKKPMRFGSSYRSRLRKARNVRVVLNANVTEIRLNGDGTAVESLNALTLERKRLTVKARCFVLACGGLENARLLLVSRGQHPRGVGNQHDVVGRYYMDHPRAVFGTVQLRKGSRLPLLRGLPLRDGKVQLGIRLSDKLQQKEGLLNHYVTFEEKVSQYVADSYQTVVQSMKVLMRRGYAGSRWKIGRADLSEIPGMIYLLTPKELMPHFVYRWYTTLRYAVNPGWRGNDHVIVYFCEQPPDPDSRVTLSPERDSLGLNRLALDWRIGDEVKRSVMRLQELLGSELRRKGLGEVEPGESEPRYSDASHHMGTTRMSRDPRSGVVDTDCRVHGLRNLYVAGGSVFPSASHTSPTLGIVALAVRMADHLRSLDLRSA